MTLKGEPPLEDLRPMPIGEMSMEIGDTFELELQEGEFRTVVVEEVSLSQYDDDEDIYYCIDKPGQEYEVCADEVAWDTVDRSQRKRIKA